MKLTLATLRAKGACESQCAEFLMRFGEQVDVTPENCTKYVDVFDWKWAGGWLLNGWFYDAWLTEFHNLDDVYWEERGRLAANFDWGEMAERVIKLRLDTALLFCRLYNEQESTAFWPTVKRAFHTGFWRPINYIRNL